MSDTDDRTFVERVLAGDALVEDIDDFVDQWHETPGITQSLAEFLGLTPDEYGLWVENADALSWVLMCRKQQIDLAAFDWDAAHQLAARAKNAEESAKLIRWLKKTGRM